MSTTRSSTSDGPFFIHIEDLPTHYTWKHLKDLIRDTQKATRGVWTDMAIRRDGQGSGRGYARVQRRKEAEDLYKYLVSNKIDGRSLDVHLWNITDSPPKLQWCNCHESRRRYHDASTNAEQSQRISSLAFDSGWQLITPPPPSQNMPVYSPYPGVQYAQYSIPHSTSPSAVDLHQQMQGLHIQQPNSTYPNQPHYASIFPSGTQPTPLTAARQRFAYTSGSLPIDITRGYATTVPCIILVRELDFKATRNDIERHFGKAGNIENLELKMDSKRKFRGTAVIQYSSAEDARRAIDRFHGREWRNRTLDVRFAKEGSTVDPPSTGSASQLTNRIGTPTIVNGSRTSYQTR